MVKRGVFTTMFFGVALSLPLLLQVFGVEVGKFGAENRALEPEPAFTLENMVSAKDIKGKALGLYLDYKEYKEKYDKYYQDNFVLKMFLFNLYNRIQLGVFATSPLPKKVVLGTDGWLFIGDGYSSVTLESKAVVNFSDEELKAIKQNLLERNEWLKGKGIDYYIAIAPEKQTFYGNYLPIKKGDRPTKWEQFEGVMHNSNVAVINLADPLVPHQSENLYYKTDSHWNDLGGFWAYRAIVDKVRETHEQVRCLGIRDFEVCHEAKYDGDLARMLNVMWVENQTILTNRRPFARLVASDIPDYRNAEIARFRGGANNLKVLVFRDSFCTAMVDYIKESFGETVFIWSYNFDKKLIEKEKPDIIIQEVVERELDQLLVKY